VAGVDEYGSPEAVQAMKLADAAWRARVAQIDNIQRVIKKNGTPEDVYRLVMSGTKAGATRLKGIYQSLDPEAQDMLTGAFVRRLGLPAAGGQDAVGEGFQLTRYLTNLNNVSKEAKDVLFNGRPELRAATEAVARVADQFKDTMRKYRNFSGTAAQATAYGIGGGAVSELFLGNLMGVGSMAAIPVANNLLANAMTNKHFVSWLAKNSQTTIEEMPQLLNQLRSMGEAVNDPTLVELAEAWEQGSQSFNEATRGGRE
jgi:methyl-accepting chemotaxis protein